MESEARRGRCTPEHAGELGRIETLPARQHQEFPIVAAQAAEGEPCHNRVLGTLLDGRGACCLQFDTDPCDQLETASSPPVVVSDDAASGPVEPEDTGFTRW